MENRYAISLDALESSAHVPFEEQVEERDTEPKAPDAVSEAARERHLMGRLAAG